MSNFEIGIELVFHPVFRGNEQGYIFHSFKGVSTHSKLPNYICATDTSIWMLDINSLYIRHPLLTIKQMDVPNRASPYIIGQFISDDELNKIFVALQDIRKLYIEYNKLNPLEDKSRMITIYKI